MVRLGGTWARALVALGVLLALCVGVWSLLPGPAPAGADPVRVRREDLVTTVEVEGELAAVRAIEIGAPPIKDLWDYKISFLAPESMRIKRGQPVIGFDTQQLQKTLEEKT